MSDTATAPATGTKAAHFTAPLHIALAELGVIRVAGADAASFLHGQLTNDIEHLPASHVRQAGYCNAKGRLLATLFALRGGDGIDLLLPREVLPSLLKKLSMFVLRAKARLADVSAQFDAHALIGPGSVQKVRADFGAAPQAPWEFVQEHGARAIRLPASPHCDDRWLLLLPTDERAHWAEKLAPLNQADPALFWWTQIDAALPTVFAATQEKFVPQMINFELVGGVNFRKGCFPGQEVVARSQYLGKLRRRMALAHVDSDAVEGAVAGADVFAAAGGQPVGTIVMSAPAPGGGIDVLFECPVENGAADLRIGGPQGPALQLRPLPYPIVDVTA